MPDISYGDKIATTGETITLEPHWPNVRAYVENAWRTGAKDVAREMAASMGCEAPNLIGQDCPNCAAYAGHAHRESCPVGQREEIR